MSRILERGAPFLWFEFEATPNLSILAWQEFPEADGERFLEIEPEGGRGELHGYAFRFDIGAADVAGAGASVVEGRIRSGGGQLD